MRRIAKLKKQRMCALAAAIVASAWMPTAMAGDFDVPDRDTSKDMIGVSDITTEIKTVDGIDKKMMNIELNAKSASVDWNSFNVGSKAEVNFNSSVGNGWTVLNRVKPGNPSEIYGKINGEGGTVFLINPSGITFHEGAEVNVGSLVASTLELTDEKKGTYNFVGGNTGVIKNLADIKANGDGFVALLAHQVVNGKDVVVENGEIDIEKSVGRKSAENTITAGQVAMAAGRNITLELQYDEKIGVRLNMNGENGGLTINNEGGTGSGYYPDHDCVINASNVNATQGYVLMKVSDINEIGTNLVCQTGTVKANRITQDKGGNIILQGDIVNAGGELTAEGENAKIGIYGSSIVTGTVSAKEAGGVIDIDTKKDAAGIVLAGADIVAGTAVNTRSNHSVIALNSYNDRPTKVRAGTDDTVGVWNITASKVKIDNVSSDGLQDLTTDKYDRAKLLNLQNNLKTKAYMISNNVVGETLETTNVNIKTEQYKGHYVYSEESILEDDLGEFDEKGDNNIEVNAPIIKQTSTKETSLTMTAFDKDTLTIDEKWLYLFKDGNIQLNADIATNAEKSDALNVVLTADNIIVNSNDGVKTGERTIYTWGTSNPGSVTINGNITNNQKDSNDPSDDLKIMSGNTEINGNTTLNNLGIYSKGWINVKGTVNVDNNMIARATDDPSSDEEYLTAKDKADDTQDVTVQGITAGNSVSLAADNDVTIKGVIAATTPSDDKKNKAVEIVAQGDFINNSGTNNPIDVGGNHWKIYSSSPTTNNFGSGVGKGNDDSKDLNSGNYAVWSWGKEVFKYNAGTDDNNRYIFKDTPKLTVTANSGMKWYGQEIPHLGYTWGYDLAGKYQSVFSDGSDDFQKEYSVGNFGTDSLGYPVDAAIGKYDVNLTNVDTENFYNKLVSMGYDVQLKSGTLTVVDETHPQFDPHNTTNLDGSASYTTAARQAAPGADRVLGLQSAELPFFREENGQTKLYGTYDVSIDPDKVKMEPTAKVLPEPDQPQNQYREYDKELTTQAGTAKFKMTYNGSTFDIYPVDSSAKNLLVAGDAAKNVEVESQALFAAFKEMGITLDDLDGVYTHFDSKKEVQSFRK
ncbi:two-partner secretion domain-containing protein [Selenomonas ruminantium]|uniref:Filamentous hemagglutinin family N-terminal domain-containing protein n=1 Tax=Selenomonas ruminantium TaxID=971 RepID=A0A1H3Y478_SELRU|nr:filamentous hemagglutinin N-terminal domain-containing protein [Selenomonas ruminantium]SEA06527.1 filamentous hemagglutinin family N-terminal domain-containing protein [Selenomonas ruminantium]